MQVECQREVGSKHENTSEQLHACSHTFTQSASRMNHIQHSLICIVCSPDRMSSLRVESSSAERLNVEVFFHTLTFHSGWRLFKETVFHFPHLPSQNIPPFCKVPPQGSASLIQSAVIISAAAKLKALACTWCAQKTHTCVPGRRHIAVLQASRANSSDS